MAKDIITLTIDKEDYFKIPEKYRVLFELKNVDVEGFDYSDSELWQIAKKESIKAYKQLKNIEFNIRHESKKFKQARRGKSALDN